MAAHVHITADLLPATDAERPGLLGTRQAHRLLRAGPGQVLGPVSQAIQTMRTDEPSRSAAFEIDEERRALRDLRKRIADQIKADIALLDALDGDADFEAGADGDATALETHGAGFCRSGHEDDEDSHDREHDQAEMGIADTDGMSEQMARFRGLERFA